MRRLIKNIEQVLYREECVVIPGIGAFLRHDSSASMDDSKGLIYPGHTDLSFNAALQQNDGVLVRQYMSSFSMGYKKALSLLESDIREFKEELRQNGLIQMGTIGRLTIDRSDDRISFLPNHDHPFSIDFYGLMPVARLPHTGTAPIQKPQQKSENKSEIFYLPINLRTLRYGAAAAVLAAAMLLIPSQKVSFPEGASQYQAGFLISQKEKSAQPRVEEKQPTHSVEEKTQSESKASVAGLPVFTPEQGVARYYVVIASLANDKQVEKYVAQHHPLNDFPNAGILVTSSGMHRVFANVYDSMEEAQKELNANVVVQDEYASSWIYERH